MPQPVVRAANGAPSADLPHESSQVTVHGLFEQQVGRTPGAVAVECDGRSLTYRDLDARAAHLAARLLRCGVGPDVPVGLLVGRSLDMLAALLGILKAGGAYVPLDPDYPTQRVSYILEDAGVRVIVADRASAGRHALTDIETIWVDEEAGGPPGVPVPVLIPAVHASHLAYLIYTSGSTGRPKGVEIPHAAVVNFLRAMRRVPGIVSSDTVAAVTTICFDIAVLELLLPLTVGARVVIAPRHVATDGRALARLLARQAVTLMQATPATWQMLLDAGWQGSEEMTILCGGEAMTRPLANRLLERCRALWNMYGPTETTVWSTAERVTAGDGPVPLGRPIANTTLHILDDRLQPVAPVEEGELFIGGAGLARGYHARPELTAARFVADPFDTGEGGRLYRTGDVVRRLPDGTLLFCGRRDLQVKIRGFRVELGEVEDALLRHPGVRQAVAVAAEGGRDSGEKRLVAYVVPRVGFTLQAGEVRERLRGRLPAYMVPARIVVLAAMPLTPNGKVDRKALPLPAGGEGAEAVAPRDQCEARLVRLWEEVLDVRPLGVEADFFALGGDSLQAAALFARIGREFGRDLPVATLVQAPTVERLAAVVRGSEPPPAWRPLVPLRTSGTKHPFFFVHGGAGTILFMRQLVAAFDPERPVYALQSAGQDGRRMVYETVEEMAALYLREVRTVQRDGPYLLGGYCFGGIVAFEMACQLRRDGEKVHFLGLVNAPCPSAAERLPGPAAGSPGVAWRAGAGAVVREWERLRPLQWGDRVRALPGRLVAALRWRWHAVHPMRVGRRVLTVVPRVLAAAGVTLPRAWRRPYVVAMTENAERRYRPGAYDGDVVVVSGGGLYEDPALGWGGYAASIQTCTLGGGQRWRRELIGRGLVSQLAAELEARLDRAEGEERAATPGPAAGLEGSRARATAHSTGGETAPAAAAERLSEGSGRGA